VAIPQASAQNPPALPLGLERDDGWLTALSLIIEDDVDQFQLGSNTDRNYTVGFGFQASGSFVRGWKLDRPLGWVDGLTRMRRAHEFSRRRFYTLTAVATAFTPDSLNTRAILPEDRPYGSIEGISVRKLTVDDITLDVAVSSELVVGAIGLRHMGDVQSGWHKMLRGDTKLKPYDPLGWRSEISDGGEPTALYRATYERHLLGDGGVIARKHVQLSGGVQGSAGYYTNLTLLSMARVGWFSSQFWEFSPAATNIATQNLGHGARRSPEYELFLFAGLRPRIVGYNALLQGQFRKSAHTFSASEIERFQAEWDLGVAAFIRPLRTQIVWNMYPGRTAEHKGAEARRHTWGSIMFVYNRPSKQPGTP
jgi:hypothetical protein